jgi:hypothetical protein
MAISVIHTVHGFYIYLQAGIELTTGFFSLTESSYKTCICVCQFTCVHICLQESQSIRNFMDEKARWLHDCTMMCVHTIKLITHGGLLR